MKLSTRKQQQIVQTFDRFRAAGEMSARGTVPVVLIGGMLCVRAYVRQAVLWLETETLVP